MVQEAKHNIFFGPAYYQIQNSQHINFQLESETVWSKQLKEPLLWFRSLINNIPLFHYSTIAVAQLWTNR